MKKSIFIIIFSFFFLILGNPVYSKEYSQQTLDKYIEKISNKFSRTYCNTIKFGISEEGAIAFAPNPTAIFDGSQPISCPEYPIGILYLLFNSFIIFKLHSFNGVG